MHKLKMFFLGLLCLMTFTVNTEATTADRVLAIVNNEVVTLSDYKRFISKAGLSASPEIVDENLLKKIISDKIILIEATKNGIIATESEILQINKEFLKNNNLSEEEFKKRLAEEGMTITEYEILLKENLISLKFIDKELNSKIFITDKEIDDYYKKNISLFIDKSDRMLVKAIFIKFNDPRTLNGITELKIKSLKIMSEIKNGEPFEKMVGLYADEPLKSNDGILGEFEKGTLITELDETISSLNEGQVSKPVWTKEGVYILKMAMKIKGNYTPLTQAKDNIYTTLYQQKREEKFNEWLKALWEKSSVTIK